MSVSTPPTADIVEALVREYLVKAGCTQAVEAFNREKPKHSNSITKREILRKSLGLDKAAVAYKKAHPEADSLPATLEYWVDNQMSRASAAWSDAPPMAPVPRPVRQVTAEEEGPEEASSPVGAAAGFVRRSSSGVPNANVNASRPSPRQMFGITDAPPTAAVARKISSMGIKEEEQPEIIMGGSNQQQRGVSPRTSLNSSLPVARAPMPVARPPSAGSARPTSRMDQPAELLMEDVDEHMDHSTPISQGVATGRASSGPKKQGVPVAPDVMRQLRQLLWGSQGQPPPSWKQGFFFNRHQGLQFGLVQKQGGPCGVLAGVQAHVLAALFEPGAGFNTTPKMVEQTTALTVAIAEALWQARMGPTAVLVLPDGEAGSAAAKLGYDAFSRAVAQHTATSKDQLMELVRSSLGILMSETGWGVVLFVMSLALSRGISNVQADMDEPSNGLMGMHGYCTQELVNMIITGTAVSNVFDGNRDLDGHALKGISRRCKLGLLTLFEWYKYVEVGPSLKRPEIPVWVVCSESHFTVLFAQDTRPLRDTLPFDLFFYDELANMESIIRLSISKDPKGGWTAKMGTTIGDRGKCEGQNIPPLECVIETRWPGVAVNWNGSDPIL